MLIFVIHTIWVKQGVTFVLTANFRSAAHCVVLYRQERRVLFEGIAFIAKVSEKNLRTFDKNYFIVNRLPNGEPEKEVIPLDIQETLDRLKENFYDMEATIRQQRLYLTSLTLQQVSSFNSSFLKRRKSTRGKCCLVASFE